MISLVSKKSQRQQQRQRQRSGVFIAVFYSALIATVVYSSSSWLSGNDNNNNNNSGLLEVAAFTVSLPSPPSSLTRGHRNRYDQHSRDDFRLFSSIDVDNNKDAVKKIDDDDDLSLLEVSSESSSNSAIRAPLKFIGPYPCLGLKFPDLATESQRSRGNQTGISLDFVLDTAANINTLQGQVAQELQLENLVDSPALPGVSSSGPMAGGETFMLGDSQLEDVIVLGRDSNEDGDNEDEAKNEPFEFMQNLTAAALPIVNPGSAGLLGLAFFYCFEGGVEFRWGSSASQPSTQGQEQDDEPRLVDGMMVQSPPQLEDDSSPSITFYGEDDGGADMSGLTRVPIDPIPLTQLPSVKIKINGVEMVALLDTGSPVTVLNERAAHAAGIKTTKESFEKKEENGNNKNSWNPFSSVVDKFKEAQATAEAASKGEILMIGGVDGKPTSLYRSIGADTIISLMGSSDDDVSFGETNKVFVGDIPGLAALNGIGVDSPPAVVLGLDVLRQRPRMLFRPRDNEVYF